MLPEIGKAEPIGIGLSPSEDSLNTPKLSPRGLMSWLRAPSDRASTRKTAYPTVFTNSAPDAIAKLDRAERRDERETESLDS